MNPKFGANRISILKTVYSVADRQINRQTDGIVMAIPASNTLNARQNIEMTTNQPDDEVMVLHTTRVSSL